MIRASFDVFVNAYADLDLDALTLMDAEAFAGAVIKIFGEAVAEVNGGEEEVMAREIVGEMLPLLRGLEEGIQIQIDEFLTESFR